MSNDTKIILSTNLESLSKVDAALVRGGRCFDVIEFQLLTLEQAIAAREMMGLEEVEWPEGKTKFTLADALNQHEMRANRKQKQGGIGFRS